MTLDRKKPGEVTLLVESDVGLAIMCHTVTVGSRPGDDVDGAVNRVGSRDDDAGAAVLWIAGIEEFRFEPIKTAHIRDVWLRCCCQTRWKFYH